MKFPFSLFLRLVTVFILFIDYHHSYSHAFLYICYPHDNALYFSNRIKTRKKIYHNIRFCFFFSIFLSFFSLIHKTNCATTQKNVFNRFSTKSRLSWKKCELYQNLLSCEFFLPMGSLIVSEFARNFHWKITLFRDNNFFFFLLFAFPLANACILYE